MNLLQYWKALNAFDWDFEYSDDHGILLRGRERRAELRELGKLSFAHGQMWSAFYTNSIVQPCAQKDYPLPPRPQMLEWKLLRKGTRYYHQAEYEGHKYRVQPMRGKYSLRVDGYLKKSGLRLLSLAKQEAENML